MTDKIGWAILGTGSIAHKFAEGLSFARGAELVAVGSRATETAEKFADQFDIHNRHASYASLAEDDQVQVIYVATPHPFHMENAITCMQAGKAVLCEKPLTVNAAQAERLVKVARDRQVFCMEAMWVRFLPSIVKLRGLLADKAIGDVRMIQADFGFRGPWKPEGRLLSPAYAGGGLLDVGIYTLSLASMVLGEPKTIVSQAHIGESGVDEQAAVVLGYDDGQLAMLACGIRTAMPQEAWIIGTEGRIHLHASWWNGSKVTLHQGNERKDFDVPPAGNGYQYQAEEVMRCLAAGELESPLMPLDESLELMRTMDEIRCQWGLKYPME